MHILVFTYTYIHMYMYVVFMYLLCIHTLVTISWSPTNLTALWKEAAPARPNCRLWRLPCRSFASATASSARLQSRDFHIFWGDLCIFVYLYAYRYVHVYIYTHVYRCMCIFVSTFLSISMFTCTHIKTCKALRMSK